MTVKTIIPSSSESTLPAYLTEQEIYVKFNENSIKIFNVFNIAQKKNYLNIHKRALMMLFIESIIFVYRKFKNAIFDDHFLVRLTFCFVLYTFFCCNTK